MINPNLAIIILLITVSLVGIVHADELTPPPSVKICGYVSYCNETGIWWFNPQNETDFAGVEIWFDNIFINATQNATTHFFAIQNNTTGIHVFSTRTYDAFSNVNQSWVNISVNIDECPVCAEGWYCDEDYCMMPQIPTITPTVTPTSWVNQTYNNATDICTVTADMGETWIKWDAVCNTTVEVLYYIDGKKLENTTPYEKLNPDRLILSDLHSGEKHNLKIYYLGNVIADSEITTLPSWYMLLFFIVLSMAFSITGLLFVRSPIFRILLGVLALLLAVWMMTMTTGWMLAVPVIPALLAALLIILALYDQVHQSWGG
jgi:hypothetical protein